MILYWTIGQLMMMAAHKVFALGDVNIEWQQQEQQIRTTQSFASQFGT